MRLRPVSVANNLKGLGSVLVADDEATQRDIACAVLTKLGYNVSAVAWGAEVLSYLRSRPADLLLFDMIMAPGMSGRATYRKVLKLYPKQNALIVSGFSESEDVKDCCRLGAGGFISKPYTIEQPGRAVKKILPEK